MVTVRSAVHELLRAWGVSRIFGNPGSNELPFLKELPADIEYTLGLHEGVVVGMADGWAQATGRTAFVNLHAAAGTGNALGALTNAQACHTPMVVTAGQQVRRNVGLNAMLANSNAVTLPQPLVAFSGEPLCAEDTPRIIAEAWHQAQTQQAPTYVSIPYDDWDKPVDAASSLLHQRVVRTGGHLDADVLNDLVDAASSAGARGALALVLGPDIDASGAFDLAVEAAEATQARVFAAPSLGRLPFPNRHPQFDGVLPAAVAAVGETLSAFELVIVLGAPVFRYHQDVPGAYLAEPTRLVQVTSHADEACRAPMGEALIADPAQVLRALARAPQKGRQERSAQHQSGVTPSGAATTFRPIPEPATSSEPGRVHPEQVFATLRDLTPSDTAYVVESTSTTGAFWQQMDLRRGASYFFPAAGGLGFGLPAAVGVALGFRDLGVKRRVVAIVGDGSANYAIPALWSAQQLGVEVDFVILRNGTYGALRWFADLLQVPDAPGMDVGGIDFSAIAEGYGVPGHTCTSTDELRRVLEADAAGPRLVQIDTCLTQP